MSAASHDSDSASEYQESESPELERRNRWKGLPSTWQRLTAQDRGVATSLELERDANLSIHLYNAHALKQRARILSEDPENALKNEYPAIPVEEQIFRPPKTWTAWPMPQDEVPRVGESNDPDDKYTYKRGCTRFPSTELEDVLIGVTLKYARERFEGRDSAVPDKEKKIDAAIDLIEEEEEDTVSSVDGLSMLKDEKPKPVPRKQSLEPVVSADDEQSRLLLRPSIRHTLSKLDEILIALHHARKTCRRYSLSEVDTDDETGSMAGSISTTRRPQGRPRKFADLPDRSVISGIEHQDPDDPDLFRSKKSHRGRPQKTYDRLPGENQQEYLIRIARIQKKPLPSFAPPLEVKEEPSSSPERTEWSPRKRATGNEQHAREKRIVGLRDWSEVLGSAALVGIPEDVIVRSTQRCVNLFGEGMVMRSMVERPYGDEDAYIEKTYLPEAIPQFEESASEDSDEESGASSDDSKTSTTLKPGTRTIGARANNVFCPINSCPRKRNGFRHNTALKKHLQTRHEVPEHQLDEYIIPSDDEMDGAVHIDGFLRSVKDFRKPNRKLKIAIKEELVTEMGSGLEDNQAKAVGDGEETDDESLSESPPIPHRD